jgi:hypothetical protein
MNFTSALPGVCLWFQLRSRRPQTRPFNNQPPAAHPTDRRHCGGDVREVCVICMSDYEAGDTRLHLPCGHAFHDECGSKWLGYSKRCPVCKREVC